MATPDFVQVAPDSTGKKVDTTAETDSAGAVERQRVSVAGIGSNNTLAIDAAGKIGVNNFPATQPVSGAVSVSNLPATQPVSVAAAAEVDGHSVTVGTTTDTSSANTLVGLLKAIKAFFGGGLPAALAGSGGLKVDLSGTAANATAVKVDGSAVTQPVSGTFWQATQPVSGSVSVGNFPATQPVSSAAASQADGHSATIGTTTDTSAANTLVGLLKALKALLAGGLPAALAASGGLKVDIAGTGANATAVKVDGSAVTQPVSGTVGVNNFPATQPVSGSVSVSNFPATQPVSAVSLPLPTGAATDANLSALIGAAADAPGTYTVLDKLKRIDINTKAGVVALQQLLALQQPKPKPAPSGTLLHR